MILTYFCVFLCLALILQVQASPMGAGFSRHSNNVPEEEPDMTKYHKEMEARKRLVEASREGRTDEVKEIGQNYWVDYPTHARAVNEASFHGHHDTVRALYSFQAYDPLCDDCNYRLERCRRCKKRESWPYRSTSYCETCRVEAGQCQVRDCVNSNIRLRELLQKNRGSGPGIIWG